jgi:IS5 family transposase
LTKPKAKQSDDDAPTPSVSADEPETDAVEPTRQGKHILDATVAAQAIRFPTGLSLLNEAREFSEKIFDLLYAKTALKQKPRTHRRKARKAYLGIVKVIQYVYEQQWEMYRDRAKRCDDRIVSIRQPYVRPIVRGQVDKPTEFGAKLSVSFSAGGVARVDQLRWDAFHEGHDLPSQV